MWRTLVAIVLLVALPATASAGPLREAAEKAGRELAAAQREAEPRSRSRLWTGIALLGGGGVLAVLGGRELREDEGAGGEMEDADDPEDAEGWGPKAMLGGGIAAAAVGGILLATGRRSNAVVSARPGRVMIRHTIRF